MDINSFFGRPNRVQQAVLPPHHVATPDPVRLEQAIRVNSPSVVRELLESGCDPNLLPTPVTSALAYKGDGKIPAHVRFVSSVGKAGIVTPLHLAVANVYFNPGDIRHDKQASNARDILEALLSHGAAVQAVASNAHVCNIHVQNELDRVPFKAVAGMTACDLALSLKEHIKFCGDVQAACLDAAITTLIAAKRSAGHARLPLVQVPSSALATWQRLLFSEAFSDVRFVCTDDGTTLHAHRAVLSAASEYFHALFSGPWASNHADGEVRTSNPSHLMRALLSFVYTGSIDDEVLDTHAETLVGVAAEYGLGELRKLAEQRLIRTLAADTVKSTLLLAHLHEAADLKAACFAFVQRNAATVLTDPNMVSLAAEQPALWAELATNIRPVGAAGSSTATAPGGKKRSRTAA